MLESKRQNEYPFNHAAKEHEADREFGLEAVEPNGQSIKHAASEHKADHALMLKAVRQRGLPHKLFVPGLFYFYFNFGGPPQTAKFVPGCYGEPLLPYQPNPFKVRWSTASTISRPVFSSFQAFWHFVRSNFRGGPPLLD